MPNWTSNTIRIAGEETELRAFLDAVKSEGQFFDFNRLIPMPALLKNTSKGHRTLGGRVVTSWYVQPESGKTRAFTASEEAALRDIGYLNWYDWSVANWGTKWNACHVAVRSEGISRGIAEITFDTAWSAPEPVFREMFAMFPRLAFTCVWRDEDDLCHRILRSEDVEA